MSRRFGRGDLYRRTPEGTEDDVRAEARDVFFDVVAENIPAVMRTFRENVGPDLFNLWDRQAEHAGPNLFDATAGALGLTEGQGGPTAVLDSLAVWVDDWNLSENTWLTLRLVFWLHLSWQMLPYFELLPRMEGFDRAPLDGPAPETIELPGWDATAETWGEYRSRIEDETLRAALMQHRADVEATPSYERTPSKVYVRKHFTWLARWQLLNETYAVIGQRDKEPTDNVARTVRRTSKLVGLTRRT